MTTSVFRIAAIALALLAVLWASFTVFEKAQNFSARNAFRECVSVSISGNMSSVMMAAAREHCALQHLAADYLGKYPPFSTERIRLAAVSRPSFILN